MQALFFFIWYCATRVSPCSVSTCLSIVAFCTFSSFTFLFFIPLVFLSHCRNRIHTRKKKKKRNHRSYTQLTRRGEPANGVSHKRREKKKKKWIEIFRVYNSSGILFSRHIRKAKRVVARYCALFTPCKTPLSLSVFIFFFSSFPSAGDSQPLSSGVCAYFFFLFHFYFFFFVFFFFN